MVAVAADLGLRLMRWQQAVLAVGLEIDPATGRPWYREVRLGVGRQSGKSVLVLPMGVHRAVTFERLGWGRRPRLKMTQQNALAARRKLLEDHVPVVESSPRVARQIDRIIKSAGREGILFNNGARLEVGGNSRDSNHGQTIHGAWLDECFAYTSDDTEQSVRPAMATVDAAQLWLLSAAGDSQSVYWHDKCLDGRARVESGLDSRIAYFEWSISDDDDIDNEALWPTFMPGLAEGLISLDTIRAEKDGMPPAVFARAFGNRWVEQLEQLIVPAHWDACLDPAAEPAGTRHFAIDCTPGGIDGRSAAISVAGWYQGIPAIDVADHREGTGWVIERVRELDRKWSPGTWTVDSRGPVRLLLGELEQVVGKRRLRVLQTNDTCAASARLHQAITEGAVRHRGRPGLDAAVAGASRRFIGDSWVFGRRSSASDVTPLFAAALAHAQLVLTSDVLPMIR